MSIEVATLAPLAPIRKPMMYDLASLGWDAAFASAYRRHDRPDQHPARVARVDRGVCTALAGQGTERVTLGGPLLVLAGRDPVQLPCTGDWVVVRDWPDRRSTIEAVLPRRTQVIRAAAGRRAVAQALAANLDVAAVVEPLDPEPDPARVERLLALAWESGARPVVVLTKADLVADPEAVAAQIGDVAPGVQVLPVDARTPDGLAALRALAGPGRTVGLLGPSGAGKSTIVNGLVGAPVMVTQRRRADGRGRHTTTFRSLVPLPGGGAVLDTPGMREVGLVSPAGWVEPALGTEGGSVGLDLVFAEIDRLAASCRYDDCQHRQEPGCAIRAALATGELPMRRYQSWLKLHREVDWRARRRARDDTLAREAKLARDARRH
jgi:ribosome biogenesis GTPase / thiamine phosphate phosphatase